MPTTTKETLMRKYLIAVLGVGLALPAWAQSVAEPVQPQAAAVPAGQVDEAAPERVLVTGKRPGPGLWKVSRGDHVLWIFGTWSPLPRKMEWRSREVEQVVAQSQEYLMPPTVSAGVGYLSGIGALPFMFGFKDIPDGKRLQDVLPADVYARWQPLKRKYFGDDSGIERQRPVFVAEELYRRALDSAGFGAGREVSEAIESIARKNKVRMTPSLVQVEIKEPGKRLREFKKSALEDTACFATTLAQLEGNIEEMRVRANAWAIGDVAVIANLDYADRKQACDTLWLTSSVANSQPELQTMVERARAAWLAAADKALANNASTFASLGMKEILDPKGLVAALRAKGYSVEPPK
jgi:hypothetical protein